MGVEVLALEQGDAVLWCNTTNRAFGPLLDGVQDGDEFIDWLEDDPRVIDNRGDLGKRYLEWRSARPAGGVA